MGSSTGLVMPQGTYKTLKQGTTAKGGPMMGVSVDGQIMTSFDQGEINQLIAAHNAGTAVTVEWETKNPKYPPGVTSVSGGMVGTTAPATPAPASRGQDVQLAILSQTVIKASGYALAGFPWKFNDDQANEDRVKEASRLMAMMTRENIRELRQSIADEGQVQITAEEPPVKEDVNFVGENKAPF